MAQGIGNSGMWDVWSSSLYLNLWPCWQILKPWSSEVCFVTYHLWIELRILHPDVNGEALTSIWLLTKLILLTKVKKCERAYGHRPCCTALPLLLSIKIQFWYSTLWSLLWYCLFDILNIIKGLLTSSVVNLMPVYNSIYNWHAHI